MDKANVRRLRGIGRGRPPVVLLGGINVARALGLGGVPVIVASCTDDEPALFSKYCVARWQLPPLGQERAVVDSLVELGTHLRAVLGSPAPLFFSNDDYLRLVNRARDRLQPRFRMLLNDADVTSALLDKALFADFARARGLPVARMLDWNGTGADALGAHDGPILIKPASKHGWNEVPELTSLFAGTKAVMRPNGAAALADAVLARLRDHVVFCEYVAGDDGDLWCFDGVTDENGNLLAAHAGRKLRCSPPLTGDSSYIELAHDTPLEALGREIAGAIPLRGIFNMDFKRDPRSGRLYLLEINARCNLWNYIGARNGLNLAKVYYDYLVTGTRPATSRYRCRYRWIDFKLDRAAYRALSGEGRLTAVRWLASLARPKVYSVFAWRDPGPVVESLRRRAMRRFTAGSWARKSPIGDA